MSYPNKTHYYSDGAYKYGECAVSWCTRSAHKAAILCPEHYLFWIEQREFYQNKLGAWLGKGSLTANICAMCNKAFFSEADYLCGSCRNG